VKDAVALTARKADAAQARAFALQQVFVCRTSAHVFGTREGAHTEDDERVGPQRQRGVPAYCDCVGDVHVLD
jgi:hypothetical protein